MSLCHVKGSVCIIKQMFIIIKWYTANVICLYHLSIDQRYGDIGVQVLAMPNCNDWLHIPVLSPVKWTENAEHLKKYCSLKEIRHIWDG